MAMHKKMYKDSPEMERDGESGKMKVKKGPNEAEKKSAEVNSGTNGMEQHEQGLPTAARHVMERRDMQSRHEAEHAVHDHTGGGSKEEMHTRHEKEMKEMHSRHEKEVGGKAPAGETEHKKTEKEGGDKTPKKKEVEKE